MDHTDRTPPHHNDIPSFEPWLGVMLAAFIPIVLAFIVPRSLMIYLFGAAGVIGVTSLVMFIQHERKAHRRRRQSWIRER